MCGIAGIYNHGGPLENLRPLVENMLSKIQYRGPDESGVYSGKQIALGSVRLSIIDIKAGHQPLLSRDRKYVIVFNGEIFNYLELKDELQKKGYFFQTDSDTEVLLVAYQAYGESCLNKLNGQFAFAIWNTDTKELFLARDRVGIRPLFYTTQENTFIFGSEIKVILEHPLVKAEIDPIAFSQIFTFWSAIAPRTVFKDIKELPPGHYMNISSQGVSIIQYWTLNFPAETQDYFKGSFQDAVEELRSILKDSVKIRLRADVTVAAYLSGGLDSSATTALIKKIAPENLQTYSIRFEDEEFDETSYQNEVSRFLNTTHKSFTCKREDIGKYFPEVIWHTETPILRTAPVPMFCLSKKVREDKIKVVITGEGADEVLAGYDIFKEAIIRRFWSKQPDSKLRPMLLNKLYPYLAQFKGKNKSMLRFFYGYMLQDIESPLYTHILRWKNTSMIHSFFSKNLSDSLGDNDPYDVVQSLLPDNFSKYDILNKSQWLESVIFMSGYLLSSQGDRVSMANSVEGRYPFLDYRVIEFAASLPPEFKMHGLNEKYILKKMMNGNLPSSVLNRSKQAYRAPVSKSFTTVSASEYISDMLSERELLSSNLFSAEKVKKLLAKINSEDITTEMDNMALAGILSSQLFYRQFILKDQFRPTGGTLKNCRIIEEEKFS
jgi:asparagine synthase (glutamine-hydrolysing)